LSPRARAWPCARPWAVAVTRAECTRGCGAGVGEARPRPGRTARQRLTLLFAVTAGAGCPGRLPRVAEPGRWELSHNGRWPGRLPDGDSQSTGRSFGPSPARSPVSRTRRSRPSPGCFDVCQLACFHTPPPCRRDPRTWGRDVSEVRPLSCQDVEHAGGVRQRAARRVSASRSRFHRPRFHPPPHPPPRRRRGRVDRRGGVSSDRGCAWSSRCPR